MNNTISATRRICGFLSWSTFSSSVFVYFLFLCYFNVPICCLCAITCLVFVVCFAFIVFQQICQNPIICIRVRMHEIRCVHIYFSAYASFRWLGFMFWYIFWEPVWSQMHTSKEGCVHVPTSIWAKTRFLSFSILFAFNVMFYYISLTFICFKCIFATVCVSFCIIDNKTLNI